MKQHLYIGTYTADPTVGGIHYATLDSETGELCYLACVAHLANPSYLAANRAGTRLYSLQEVAAPGATVCAFAINADKTLSLLSELPVPGDSPCHLSLDASERWLFVSNYGSGSLAVYRLRSDGALDELVQLITHEGSGSHPNQDAPHSHCAITSPDNRQLWVAELGANALLCYDFDPTAIFPLSLAERYAAAEGAGPRHLCFHPDGQQLFVINELNSSLSHYRYDGRLTLLASYSTLPAYRGDNSCAAIKLSPCGRYLLASNRGHDSLAVFELIGQQLHYRAHLAAGGQTPRDFSFDASGRWLIVAHQDSDSLGCYRFEAASGRFEATPQRLSVEQPVCLLAIDQSA